MSTADEIDSDCVVMWPVISSIYMNQQIAYEGKSTRKKSFECPGLDESEQEVKDILTCSICFGLAINPQDCKECDTTFCSKCLGRMKGKPCPICKCKSQFKKAHKLVKLLLDRTLVSCPNKLKYNDCINVCETSLPIPEMIKHLENQCPFRVAKCAGTKAEAPKAGGHY